MILKHFMMILGFFLFTSVSAPCDQYDIHTLEAVFLERFTRFINWPPEALNDKGPFVIAVVGKTPVEKRLEEIYRNRMIMDMSVEIVHIEEKTDHIPLCHVLFIGEISEDELGRLIDLCAKRPILTVSDTPGFARKGVRINFFSADSRLRFEINERAIRDSGLAVSYLLLKQAEIIDGTTEP